MFEDNNQGGYATGPGVDLTITNSRFDNNRSYGFYAPSIASAIIASSTFDHNVNGFSVRRSQPA